MKAFDCFHVYHSKQEIVNRIIIAIWTAQVQYQRREAQKHRKVAHHLEDWVVGDLTPSQKWQSNSTQSSR